MCIEILNGWPGVYTGRFLGKKATQSQRNEAILKKMENMKKEQRKAKVICVIAYFENGKFMIQKGEIEGTIAQKPKGENGFGFDTIFELENGKTFAQLSAKEKNTISHRRKALENLGKQLTNQ